ncbi:hypothetical protein Q8F55_005143 [Vanrija albida]|uniref:Zn(2)-C6 fungal-type domain-containing protein n=1 Tax=Vanrija albida TaxID=181172 RepID=A0ABR3Q112_9TREE
MRAQRRPSPSRSPSPTSSPEDAHRRKRSRIPVACLPCRSRKQSCTGGHPCLRCEHDGRACSYGEKEAKTPLTRQRMTALEERIAQYDALWSGVFARYDFDAACADFEARGPEAVLAKLAALHLGGSAAAPIAEQRRVTPQSPPRRAPALPDGDSSEDDDDEPATLPPTRAASPAAVPLLIEPEETYNYEWAEDAGVAPRDDAGMGSMIHGRGTSYFGLSSGAAFLNAIHKLTPGRVAGVSPVQASEHAAAGMILGDPWCSSASPHDWDSPCAATVAIPPYSEVRGYVDGYFKYFHPITTIVHEPTVRAQVTGALRIPAKPGTEVLLNMVFAMGALDSGTSAQSADGNKYYLVARRALQRDILEGGTLALVQGLAIMPNYLQRSGRPNAGYMCLGWALRMAMTLGLHTPVTSPRCTPFEREMRLRVWWAVVTMEAGCSVTFGRPHPAGAFQLDAAPLPINCDDEHLTVGSAAAPENVEGVTLYSALVVQSRLARVTCALVDRILHSNPAPAVHELRKYDRRIVSVLEAMPEYMRSAPPGPYCLAMLVQRWRARDIRAILYRPLLLGAAWGNRTGLSRDVLDAIEICRSLAVENAQDIAQFMADTDDSSRCTEWYAIYFAFQAALTLLLSVVAEPDHPSTALWRQVIISTAAWFQQCRSMTSLGASYARVLENVLGAIATPHSAEAAGLAGLQSLLSSWAAPDATVQDGNELGFDMDRYWLEIWGLTSGIGASLDTAIDEAGLAPVPPVPAQQAPQPDM